MPNMQEIHLVLLAGFALGSLHAFDVDHLAAVGVFVSRDPHPGRAVRLGIRWALGHSIALSIVGAVCLGLRVVISPVFQSVLELAVGTMLIAIGIWGLLHFFLATKLRRHPHVHEDAAHTIVHSHAHLHFRDSNHRHSHSVMFIGAVHGLAGTGPVLIVIPITLLGSWTTTLSFILLFNAGMIVAMAFFANILSRAFLLVRSRNIVHCLQGLAGATCVLLGSWWIFRILS